MSIHTNEHLVCIVNHVRPVKGQPSLYSFSAADMDARSVMEQRLQVQYVTHINIPMKMCICNDFS